MILKANLDFFCQQQELIDMLNQQKDYEEIYDTIQFVIKCKYWGEKKIKIKIIFT